MPPITTHSPYCIEVSLQRKCAVVHSQSRQQLDVLILSLAGKFYRAPPSFSRKRAIQLAAVASSTTAICLRMASIDLVSACPRWRPRSGTRRGVLGRGHAEPPIPPPDAHGVPARASASKERRSPCHAISITRPIAAVRRSQVSVSTFSCLRPEVVRR